MKKIIWLLFFVLTSLAQAEPLRAEPTQFYLEDTLGDGFKARIYVAADTAQQAQVQDALYQSTDHAKAAFAKLNAASPESEISRINRKKTARSYTVSPELARALEIAHSVSKETDGRFDVTFSSPLITVFNHAGKTPKSNGDFSVDFKSPSGSYKNIKINPKTNELKITADGLTIDLRHILAGLLADLIAKDLSDAGWKSALVKVEEAYVAHGSDVNEPWKIPVVEPKTDIAKRVLLYRATGVGAATVGGKRGLEVIDPKTKSAATPDFKSVTVFDAETAGAARAQGLATAVYCMGFEEGERFIRKHKKTLRAVFGNTDGSLTNIPEFKSEK